MGAQNRNRLARRAGGVLLGAVLVLLGKPFFPLASFAAAEQDSSTASADTCFVLRKTSHKSVRREAGIITVQMATLEVLEGKWTLWYAGGELEVAPGRSFTVSPGDAITEIEGQGREFEVKSVESGTVLLEEQRRYILPGATTPFKLQQVSVRHVDVLFKSIFKNPFKLRLDVKFNWGRGAGTEYVPMGEMFHGYTVFPGPLTLVEQPDGEGTQKVKQLFVTLRRPGTDPIIIEMGKTSPVTERIATLDATTATWRVFHRDEKLSDGKKVFDVFEGCAVREIEGDRRVFKVARINDERVTLEGASEHVLKLPSPVHK